MSRHGLEGHSAVKAFFVDNNESLKELFVAQRSFESFLLVELQLLEFLSRNPSDDVSLKRLFIFGLFRSLTE